MNLRTVKKDIEYVLGAFVEDCTLFAEINSSASEELIAPLMEEAVNLYNELRDKVNARGVEGSKKAYFTALRKEVLEKTDALYEKLSEAVKKALDAPAEKKAPAKKAEEAPAKKAPAKKAPAKKAEEAPAEKAPAKKAAAKKAEEAPAKKAAAPKEAPAEKKAPAKKTAAKKDAE